MSVTLTLYADEVDHILYLLRTSECTDTHGIGVYTRTECLDIERRIEDQLKQEERMQIHPEHGPIACPDGIPGCTVYHTGPPPPKVETDTERIARLEYRLAKLEKRLWG